jgi:hypothetical protein
MNAYRCAAILALSTALGACAGAKDVGPHDATKEAAASAAQRLAGSWLLVRYDPEVPLDGVSSLFVQSQVGKMIVRIDRDVLTAEGPGVSVTRRIQIGAAYGDHFDAQIVESSGIGNDTSNEFQGDKLVVVASGSSWRGKALLSRIQR